MLKKFWKYLIKSWDDEEYSETYIHPRMKIFPLVVWKIFALIIVIGLICNLILYLFF